MLQHDSHRISTALGALIDSWNSTPNGPSFRGSHRTGSIPCYQPFKLHAVSSWEHSESQTAARVRLGVYNDWKSWRASHGEESIPENELLELVVHGYFEIARPLLTAYADATPSSMYSEWARWLAGHELDERAAAALLSRDGIHAVGLANGFALAYSISGRNAATQYLEEHSTRNERELSDRPCKTIPKLYRQALAFEEGGIDAAVLRKSFRGCFGYCYHYESPSNLSEKLGPVWLYGRLLERGTPPHVLFATIKECLPMFTEQRRAAKREYVGEIEPLIDAVHVLQKVLARERGLTLNVSGETVELVDSQPEQSDRDFF